MSIGTSIAVLGGIGAIGALALNRVAKKFHVEEDQRISQVEECLPGANCGGCGQNGCHDFAVKCVEAGSLDQLFCPVGGQACMAKVAGILGVGASGNEPKLATLRCAGTPLTKTHLNVRYSGPKNCSVMNLTAGDYLCLSSCLGCGDCARECQFGAITIDQQTHLPLIDAEKCSGCGRCAITCPRGVIEMRDRGVRGRRVWVACGNCLKGAQARKQCATACLGCGLCAKACHFDAIIIENNLARIDAAKCKACGKCADACPTHAIHKTGFPAKKATTD